LTGGCEIPGEFSYREPSGAVLRLISAAWLTSDTQDGCVATSKLSGNWVAGGTDRLFLGGKREQLFDEPVLTLNILGLDPPNLSFPDHIHRLISLNRSPSRLKFPEALVDRTRVATGPLGSAWHHQWLMLSLSTGAECSDSSRLLSVTMSGDSTAFFAGVADADRVNLLTGRYRFKLNFLSCGPLIRIPSSVNMWCARVSVPIQANPVVMRVVPEAVSANCRIDR
jgi:hypothetical protein